MVAEPLIKDVSDTAFWIAHLRAVESGRTDALFCDPLAERLAGRHGREVSAAMPMERMIAWHVAIRTHIIDDYLRSAIAEGVDCVLNLGAGLDTRPYRMDLPPSLRWIEADYPRVIEYKEELLAGERAHCQLVREKIDLADLPERRRFLASVNAQSRRLLILTEGVVPYLTNDETAALADDLRRLDHAAYWIVDYVSAQAMKFRKRKGMDRAMQNAPFRFEPADWFAFFEQHGWKPKEMRYIAPEGERLGRPIPAPWLMKAAMRIAGLFMAEEKRKAMHQFMGYALLQPS
jgi:methyltransferase (TIGR00027 family)